MLDFRSKIVAKFCLVALIALPALATLENHVEPDQSVDEPVLEKQTPAVKTREPGAAGLSVVQAIPLPGVEERIDHLAVDVQRRRLFVAALGNNTVEVVDLNKGVRVRSIPGIVAERDRKSTRLNSSHVAISYAVFCLKKKKQKI